MASRATLARRLRAVERALSVTEGLEFESRSDPGDPGPTDGRIGSMEGRLDLVEERTEALCRAVRALGEFLVARDRARPDDGVESIRRTIAALPDAATEGDGLDGNRSDGGTTAAGADPDTTDTTVGDAVQAMPASETVLDETGATDGGESATEWLERVASGGVIPPAVE